MVTKGVTGIKRVYSNEGMRSVVVVKEIISAGNFTTASPYFVAKSDYMYNGKQLLEQYVLSGIDGKTFTVSQ